MKSADFTGSYFYNADFSGSNIMDNLYIGNNNFNKIPIFDFRLANFYPQFLLNYKDSLQINIPGTSLILCGPVKLIMQIEKFKYLSFEDSLDYFTKKNIISILKENSYNGPEQSKERFELDYLLAKSTMYQNKTSTYNSNKWYDVPSWPRWFFNWLYYITLGMGYRPFRLIYWALLVISSFTVIYTSALSKRVNAFLSQDWRGKKPLENAKDGKFLQSFGNILNALYFSASIFFTFRLKKDILLFFNRREKLLISIEWILGFIIYFSFIAFSKKGSILHTLTSLFTSQ